MSLCVYVHELVSNSIVKVKSGVCCPVKEQLYVHLKYAMYFSSLFTLLLHLIRRSHRDASHLFFAACVERSAPAVLFLAVKTHNLEHAH